MLYDSYQYILFSNATTDEMRSVDNGESQLTKADICLDSQGSPTATLLTLSHFTKSSKKINNEILFF
jgi:hypothetical protein